MPCRAGLGETGSKIPLTAIPSRISTASRAHRLYRLNRLLEHRELRPQPGELLLPPQPVSVVVRFRLEAGLELLCNQPGPEQGHRHNVALTLELGVDGCADVGQGPERKAVWVSGC
jgi:hypothetical protein